jgi:hypothetical protein
MARSGQLSARAMREIRLGANIDAADNAVKRRRVSTAIPR